MCAHRLNGGTLCCDREDEHEPGRGCTYRSSAGDHTKASEPVGHDQ